MWTSNESQTSPPNDSSTSNPEQPLPKYHHKPFELKSQSLIYIIESIIGKGTFGLVYKASLKSSPNFKFAIKRYYRNIHPDICQLEMSIISYLNKRTNNESILRIYDGFLYQGDLFIVTPYVKHRKFSDFCQDISLDHLKDYWRNWLECLKCIHDLGILHRDVKPDNFLYETHTQKAMLIDFGLAEADWDNRWWFDLNKGSKDEDCLIIEEWQKHNYRHRTGTKGYTAPEIFFKSQTQSNVVDIYAAGVIFACFAAKRCPVFNLNNFVAIDDQIIKDIEPLIILHGRKKVWEIAKKFKATLYISDIFAKYESQNGLKTLVKRKDLGKDGIDLLKRMLELDPDLRISAKEALDHPFWKKEKNKLQGIVMDNLCKA